VGWGREERCCLGIRCCLSLWIGEFIGEVRRLCGMSFGRMRLWTTVYQLKGMSYGCGMWGYLEPAGMNYGNLGMTRHDGYGMTAREYIRLFDEVLFHVGLGMLALVSPCHPPLGIRSLVGKRLSTTRRGFGSPDDPLPLLPLLFGLCLKLLLGSTLSNTYPAAGGVSRSRLRTPP
jgi:hypothetical protein